MPGVAGNRTRRAAAPASIETSGLAGRGVSGRPRETAPTKQRKASNRQGGSAAVGAEQETATAITTTTTTAAAEVSRSIKNVTAQNGQSVLLPCLVEPSADISVSWFRGTGELQLLSYGTTTIIQDDRFIVRPGASRDNDCALQIKNLDKATDSGLYQCQTSEEPPQSQYYQLNVVEPQVAILGSPDLAVKLGAPINLTCVISQSADQFQFIFWYRDERMINYDIANEARGKIVVSKSASNRLDSVTSSLQIFQSKLSDAGNYTCAPSGARSTSIYVHILEANDKRLMMFQNDELNQLQQQQQQQQPPAASSQSTSSAISVHVARLSRGRAYALFVAYFIFSSWFHLVAQVQTAISLFLLAIIGLFVSNSTRKFEPKRHSTATGARKHNKLDLKALEQFEDRKLLKKKLKKKKKKRFEGQLHDNDDNDDEDVELMMRYKLNVSATSDGYDARREVIKLRPEEGEHEEDDQRHLERAKGALELLRRSLQVVESNSSEDEDEDGHSTVFNQLDETTSMRTTTTMTPTSTTNTRRDCKVDNSRCLDNQPDDCRAINSNKSNKINQLNNKRPTLMLTSPSASTSSGNSTGYNSDSRQTCPGTPTSNSATDRLEQFASPSRSEVAGGSGRGWRKPSNAPANNRVVINDSRPGAVLDGQDNGDDDDNSSNNHQVLEMIDLLRRDQPIAMSLLFEASSSSLHPASSPSNDGQECKVDTNRATPDTTPCSSSSSAAANQQQPVLFGSDCASTSPSSANGNEPHYATPAEGTANSRHRDQAEASDPDNGVQAPPLGGPS